MCSLHILSIALVCVLVTFIAIVCSISVLPLTVDFFWTKYDPKLMFSALYTFRASFSSDYIENTSLGHLKGAPTIG